MVKCLPAMRETGFNPWVGKIPWRRKWQPTPVLLPGKFHGWREGNSWWGCKESDTTERLHFYFHWRYPSGSTLGTFMELPQAVRPCMTESLVSLHSSFTALLWLFPLESHRPSFWPMNCYSVCPSRTFELACSRCCSIHPPNTHLVLPLPPHPSLLSFISSPFFSFSFPPPSPLIFFFLWHLSPSDIYFSHCVYSLSTRIYTH